MNNNYLSMISLAKKAGKVKSGEFQTENAVKDGTAKLVIVSLDAGKNTKKLFTNKCHFYKVPLEIYGTKEALGSAIGCSMRTSIAIIDENLGAEIKKRIDLNKQTEV